MSKYATYIWLALVSLVQFFLSSTYHWKSFDFWGILFYGATIQTVSVLLCQKKNMTLHGWLLWGGVVGYVGWLAHPPVSLGSWVTYVIGFWIAGLLTEITGD